jgi:hypothetical protein
MTARSTSWARTMGSRGRLRRALLRKSLRGSDFSFVGVWRYECHVRSVLYYIMEHDPDAVCIERACWIVVLCAAGPWRAESPRRLQDMSDEICPCWLGRVLPGMILRCLSLRRQECLKHLTWTPGINVCWYIPF